MNHTWMEAPQPTVSRRDLPAAARPLMVIGVLLGMVGVIAVTVSLPGNGDVTAVAGVAAVLSVAYVYSRWGGFGLLLGYALTLWYPFTLYYVVRLLGPLTLTMHQLAILAVGSGILFLRFAGAIRGPAPVVVPGVVAVVATGAWTLTWSFTPPTETVNQFLGVIASVLVLVVCLALVRTARQARLLCWAAAASVMLTYGVVAMSNYITPLPIVSGSFAGGTTRLYGLLELPGASGFEVWGGRATGVIAAAMVVPLVYLLAARTTRERVLSGVPLVVLAAIETTSGGRAGWVGILVAGVAVILVGVGVGCWRFSRLTGALAGAVLMVVVAYGWIATRQGVLEVTRTRDTVSPMLDSGVRLRLQLWAATLTQIQRHPEGIGFYAMLRQYGIYEHNTFLVLATGLGVVGALAFVFLWVWLGHRAVLAVRSEEREVRLVALCGLGTLIVALVAGMFENTPFLSEMFWLVWGAAAALSYRYARRAT